MNIQRHKKVFAVIVFGCSALVLHSQGLINLFDFDRGNVLCQPGVTNKSPGQGAALTYLRNPGFQMHSSATDASSRVRHNEQFEAKLKVPLVIEPQLKVLLGFKYSMELFDFSNLNETTPSVLRRLNESTLKTAEFGAYATIPINEKYYTSFRLTTSFSGDYGKFINFDSRYGSYNAAGIFGVKKSDDLEYGAGLAFSRRFGASSLLPFGFYNRTFNEYWGLEAVFPISVKVRYQFNERSLMLFGPGYSSQRYALAVREPVNNPFQHQPEKAPYQYRRAAINLKASYYYQITGWTWIQFHIGYYWNTDSRAIYQSTGQEFQFDTSNSFQGAITVFVTPPSVKH